MIILPAIDLFEGAAVRLLRGDYNKMTVYEKQPETVAQRFEAEGATHIHIVDLEGAKTGGTPNLETVKRIVNSTSLSAEIGGGIRNFSVIEQYLNAGVDRVILGTAAVTEEGFVKTAVQNFGDKIVVGADIKDGFVAIRGWTENSKFTCGSFCEKMQNAGVKTLICTDISKDGTLSGPNISQLKEINDAVSCNIIASGGITNIDDILALKAEGLYGAICGKSIYSKSLSLARAVKECE